MTEYLLLVLFSKNIFHSFFFFVLVFLFGKWVGHCLWIKLHIYELSMLHDMKGANLTWSDFQPLHLPPHMTVTIHFVKCVFTFDFFLRFGLCHRKKHHRKSKHAKFWQYAHAICNLPPLYNCTCVAWKMHSFSTNQKHMISFSCVLSEI